MKLVLLFAVLFSVTFSYGQQYSSNAAVAGIKGCKEAGRFSALVTAQPRNKLHRIYPDASTAYSRATIIAAADEDVTNTQNFDALDAMRRDVKPYQPLPFSTPESVGEMVNIYTTETTVGNLKMSCDYIFNDEGRLIDAEPTWWSGK